MTRLLTSSIKQVLSILYSLQKLPVDFMIQFNVKFQLYSNVFIPSFLCTVFCDCLSVKSTFINKL